MEDDARTLASRDRRPNPLWLVGLIAWLGCVPDDGFDPIGDSDLAGTVRGQDFVVRSGSAELNIDTYAVTLADTTEFSCDSVGELPANYLQIVIGEIDEPTTFPAEGRVFFNSFEGGVSESEPADSGTVTISTVDSFGRVIDGSIDAAGATSSVTGDFSVEICP